MKSPQRRQSLWKAAQPRLTNYSSAFPLEEANVIIPFAKRECEHICSSTHPLGTPSQCKLPQLTLCHSSTATTGACVSGRCCSSSTALSRWDGPPPCPLLQVKQMSGSFGGSSPPWLCCRHSWSSPSRRTLDIYIPARQEVIVVLSDFANHRLCPASETSSGSQSLFSSFPLSHPHRPLPGHPPSRPTVYPPVVI